jgi:hypothetical protein
VGIRAKSKLNKIDDAPITKNKGMHTYKHNQGGPKWKVFKRFNAKIQAQSYWGERRPRRR